MCAVMGWVDVSKAILSTAASQIIHPAPLGIISALTLCSLCLPEEKSI